jgi:anti-sigma-K factor RskA
MSRNESVDSHLNHDVLAFEYVTGVLRGEERRMFERLLQTNDTLADQVRFWEEQLMQLSDENEVRKPDADVWKNIQANLNAPAAHREPELASKFMWPRWFMWAMPSLAVMVLAFSFFLVTPLKNSSGPNADYVAVLTDPQGAARLTVLTATSGKQLWLKWDSLKIAPDKNVQLWAVSKSDKQIRPLGVFMQTDIAQLELTTANWRLIKDAESLLLTEEEVGGSPIDEPSEVILAKGVCVLLVKLEHSI